MGRIIVLEDFAFDSVYLHSFGIRREDPAGAGNERGNENEKGRGQEAAETGRLALAEEGREAIRQEPYLLINLISPKGMQGVKWRSRLGIEGTVEAFIKIAKNASPKEEPPMTPEEEANLQDAYSELGGD
jgi:hypothetical protein